MFKVGDKVLCHSISNLIGTIVDLNFGSFKSYLVDFGEDFDGHDGHHLTDYVHPTDTCWWCSDDELFFIDEKHYRPKTQEIYYYVTSDGGVARVRWYDCSSDYYQFNANNCFETYEEITPQMIEDIVFQMTSEYNNVELYSSKKGGL